MTHKTNGGTDLNALTKREHEVLKWDAEGKTNWEIAQILGCQHGTVRKHIQRIHRKLGVENRTAAARFYLDAQNEKATNGV